MRDSSVFKLGGVCGILAGVLALACALIFLLLPAEQRDPTSAAFLASLAQQHTLFVAHRWLMAAFAVFGIAAMMAISSLVGPANEGLVRWTYILALLGYGLTLVNNVNQATQLPRLLTAYQDPSARAALAVIGIGVIDPYELIQTVLPGLWFLVVNWLAFRRGDTHLRHLACVGAAFVALYAVQSSGLWLGIKPLYQVGNAVGYVVVWPAWFIYAGIILTKAASPGESCV